MPAVTTTSEFRRGLVSARKSAARVGGRRQGRRGRLHPAAPCRARAPAAGAASEAVAPGAEGEHDRRGEQQRPGGDVGGWLTATARSLSTVQPPRPTWIRTSAASSMAGRTSSPRPAWRARTCPAVASTSSVTSRAPARLREVDGDGGVPRGRQEPAEGQRKVRDGQPRARVAHGRAQENLRVHGDGRGDHEPPQGAVRRERPLARRVAAVAREPAGST